MWQILTFKYLTLSEISFSDNVELECFTKWYTKITIQDYSSDFGIKIDFKG